MELPARTAEDPVTPEEIANWRWLPARQWACIDAQNSDIFMCGIQPLDEDHPHLHHAFFVCDYRVTCATPVALGYYTQKKTSPAWEYIPAHLLHRAEGGLRRAGRGMHAIPLPPAELGGWALRPATPLATAVSVADAVTTKVIRLTVEGEELRVAAVQHRETFEELRSRLSAAEISVEQINHAARDAHSKLYQHWYNGRMTEVAVLVSPEILHAEAAAQPHRH
eukprot:jgi/Tetstr1/434311/TSEL_023417.t1